MAEQIGLEAVFDMDKFDQGITKYLQGLSNVDNQTTKVGGSFGAAFDTMGNKVLGAATTLSKTFVVAAAAATAAIGAFVVGGISSAADLESQMGGIASIMGETKEAVGPLKDLILDLGLDPNLKVSATEAADAIEKLASNGLTMTQIMDGAAKSTVLLANSTGADFDTAAGIATDTMALFNIKAEDMMTAVNGITGVTVASKFGINDYRLALAQAGGVAAATGVSFEDFNTSITGMSNYFASGSDAGTSFKTMLLRLVPSTDAASEMMNKLGLVTFQSEQAMKLLEANGIKPLGSSAGDLTGQLYNLWASQNATAAASDDGIKKFNEWKQETGLVTNAFYDANGSMRDMSEISVLLNGALGDLSEEEKSKALNTMFGTDAMRAAVGIAEQGEVAYTDQATAAKELGVSFESLNGVIDGGITKFEALQIQIGKTDAVESAKLRMDNFKGSMEILQGVIDTVALQIGFAFLPMLKAMADNVASFISDHAAGMVQFFEDLAAGIEAFVSGAPGDFPWEDIFPPWLATTMYTISQLVEGLGMALTDFNSGAMGADYPWEDIFPEWLANIIYFVTENIDALTGALGGVAALLASAGIAAAISALGAALAVVLSPMGLMIIGAAALGAAWNTNFLGIRDITLAVVTPVKDFLTTLLQFGPNSEQAWAALGTLQGKFGELLGVVGNKLTEWKTQLGEWASAVGEKLLEVDYQKIGGDILNSIKEGWTSVVSTSLSVVTGWTTSVSTAIKNVDWSSVGSSILTFIKDGWESAKGLVATNLGTIVTSWKSQFGDSVQGWTAAGKEILDKVRAGMDSAKTTLTAGITTLVGEMKTRYLTPEGFQWNTLGTDISNSVRDGLQSASRAAGGIIASALTIATSIKNQFTTLTWTEIGTLIIDSIKKGLEDAAKAASGLLAAVKKIGLDSIEALKNVSWEDLGRTIGNLVRDGLKAVIEGVGGLLPTVRTAGTSMKSVFTDIDWIDLGKTILNGIVTGVKAIAFGAAGLIYIVGTIAKGFTEALFGVNWEEQGQKILQNIQKGIENAKSTLLEVVRAIPTAIKQIFTDMTQQFKDIGKAIVDGIGEGITGAKDALMEKAKSLANALPGWVKEVLGISSPSKAFMIIGSQIIEGLVVGIESGASSVKGALDRITSSLTQADLLNMDFKSSDTFASRIRKDYLGVSEDFLKRVTARKEELQRTVSALQLELQRPGIDATRQSDLTTWLGLAIKDLTLYTNVTAKAAQEVADFRQVLYLGDVTRDNVSFLEDQIDLMKQARSLGIDISGVNVGDNSIANLTKMANLEKRIAELKESQLYTIANQLKAARGNPLMEGLQRTVSEQDSFNGFLNNQLGLMKKAGDLGMDLLTVWNSYVTFDQNDAQKQLEFQKKLGELTKQDMLNQMTAMIAEQKRVKGLESALKQLQPLMDMTNVSSVFGQRYKATVLDPLLRALEEAAGIDSERVRLMAQYTAAAQKLADIQKKEEQLSFLKEQLDMVKMIRDQDLVGGDSLFNGIAFGVNASIDDLLTLTSRVLNAMVTETKDELGIHSPSTVFAEIGSQMMAGLAQGIQSNVMQPLSSLRDSTLSHGAVSSRTLNLAMGGVNIYSGMDEVMFERRVQRIIERSL